MNGYTEINGINISNSLINFLDQHFSLTGDINRTFRNILMENHIYGYINEKDYNTIFKDVKKIDICDDGYLLFNNSYKIKFGRFVLKILKIVWENVDFKFRVNPYIESYVDDYKSWYKINSNLEFKYLKGEDILEAYSTRNYKNVHFDNMLSASCMNNHFSSLDLYVKNPDKINLLVLVDDKNKIYGRALVWKLDNKPYLFMDRIYSIDNYINNIFIDYAKKNKIAYRSNKFATKFKIYLPNGKTFYNKKIKFKVKLNTKEIYKYPYIDTMFNWNKLTNKFTNKINRVSFFYEELTYISGYFTPGIKFFGKRINF